MWPPGRLQAGQPRAAAVPAVRHAELLRPGRRSRCSTGIKTYRGTAILPQRTGPVIDVLYSAAGNQRRRGVLQPRHHRLRLRDRRRQALHANGSSPATGGPGQQPPFGDSTNDCLANEGHDEAMEFADGNYGAAAVRARVRQRHDAAGRRTRPSTSDGKGTYEVRFTSNEASSIYYTTDGSTPTTASTEWKPPRARALPLPVVAAPGTTLKWIATRLQGQHVRGEVAGARRRPTTPGGVGGTVPATLSLTIGHGELRRVHAGRRAGRTPRRRMANVISTAGDAHAERRRPELDQHGQADQRHVRARPDAAGARGPAALANVGSSAAPTGAEDAGPPRSPTRPCTVDFSQAIGANEALRTGTYSKTLTFTLSTTHRRPRNGNGVGRERRRRRRRSGPFRGRVLMPGRDRTSVRES